MKIGVSMPEDLVAFADEEAKRRGLSRSALLANLLQAEKVREQTCRHIDQHGWDVTEDEEAWKAYQRRRRRIVRSRSGRIYMARLQGFSRKQAYSACRTLRRAKQQCAIYGPRRRHRRSRS